MRSAPAVLLSVLCVACCEALENGELEARGKKKKIALFVFIADLVVKKIFVLKLIYAFVFWLVIHKAGYFLSWFISEMKERKKDHDHHDYSYHDHHSYHDRQNYQGSSHYPYSRPYRKSNAGRLFNS